MLFATPLFAQIDITIGTPEPNCTYGYFDYAPYACAPYGYYGPEFFVNGRYHPRHAWGRNNNYRGKSNGYHQSRQPSHDSKPRSNERPR